MKIRKRSKASCVGVLSGVAALSLLAMAMVFPEVDGAFAADPTCKESKDAEGDLPICEQKTGNIGVNFEVKDIAESDDYEVGTDNLLVQFTVNPYIQLDMANPKIETTAQMGSGSAKVKGYTPFSVRTNSSSGFAVYVTTTDALLKMKAPGVTDEERVISPLTGESALDDFTANSWGYSVTEAGTDATTYRGVTTATADDKTSAYGKDGFSKDPANLQLNFGAKVSDTLPSGTYQTTVTVSAVISSAEVANLP